MNSVFKVLPNIWNSQRGITGLETAIVLIAFVVVSSVFAFAALSTGMFSSDKARETITAGLAQTRSTMELKGSVIGTSDVAAVTGVITTIEFHLTFQEAFHALPHHWVIINQQDPDAFTRSLTPVTAHWQLLRAFRCF